MLMRRMVRLRFRYPLALPYSSKWVRLRFLLVHYILALGFFMEPLSLLGAVGLASLALFFELWRKNAFVKESIVFGWQRVAFSAIVALLFLGFIANGQPVAQHWWWVSLIFGGLSLYDGYLAYRGVTGLFYIRLKGVD